MGTFTKSFGSVGGYIAGDKVVIDHVKALSAASAYAASMSPTCAAQCIASLNVIRGDGTFGSMVIRSSPLLWSWCCHAADTRLAARCRTKVAIRSSS